MELPEHRYNVCLSSSSNLDIFPNNNRTFFTNTLPVSMSNHEQKEIFVRVKSVGLAIDPAQPPVGYVKIQLFEVEEQASGFRKFDRVLGGFEYPGKNEDGSNYVFKTFGAETPFLPLRFQILNQLRILITDINDKRINLDSGGPTIVYLEIVTEDEMRDQNSFCITCSSNQPDLFISNTLAKFTCPLPEMIELHDYEVALINVVYPPLMREESVIEFQVENEMYSYNLLDYSSITNLIRAINTDLQKMPLGRELQFVRRAFKSAEGRTTMCVGIKRGRAPVGVPQANYLQIKFTWAFNQVLGEYKNLQNVLMLRAGEIYVFSGEPNLYAVLPNPVALLTCDAVTPSLVGGELKPLLNCVPVKLQAIYNVQGGVGVKMHEPKHLHYVNVKETPFDSISFEFLNPGLKLYPRIFHSDNPLDCVSITLAFRPKRQM